MHAAPAAPEPAAAADRVLALVRRLVEACPRRVAGSASEARAQDLLAEAFQDAGCETAFHHFRHSRSLYQNMALHFGLAVLGSAFLFAGLPLLALPLHAVVAVSWTLESAKRRMVLRRLFPFHPSRNLLATLPAEGEPALRVVVVGHADAAYTGRMFEPEAIRAGTQPPPIPGLGFLRKGMRVATGAVALLALLDLNALLAGTGWLLYGLAAVATVPALLAFLLNLDVVLRDEVVPGANDNLTGCAGAVELARRLRADKPADVELVFVATGAEEAGTGGSWALSLDGPSLGWDPRDTVVLVVDSLSNGEMRWFIEGEVLPAPPPAWMEAVMARVAASDPRFSRFARFEIPSGASDALSFLARGYAALGIGTVDPSIGAPRHYHHPTDTPDNLDRDELAVGLAVAEAALRALIAERRPA